MTIELNQEQESALQRLIDAGYYDTPQDFIDEALADAYTRTKAFKRWAREKLDASQRDLQAGRVVTVVEGDIGETLERLRDDTLEFKR